MLFAIFLILSACVSKPVETKFDAKWEFCEIRPQEHLACLKEDDVKELRKLLIKCSEVENAR